MVRTDEDVARVVGVTMPVGFPGQEPYPAGSVLKVTAERLAEMREKMPGYVFDLTPRPLAAMINALFSRRRR